MPIAKIWTEEQQVLLISLSVAQRMPMSMVATRMGASRSFLQRKLARHVAEQQEQRMRATAAVRRLAGMAPLPPGHDLSWTAISTAAYEMAPY